MFLLFLTQLGYAHRHSLEEKCLLLAPSLFVNLVSDIPVMFALIFKLGVRLYNSRRW